MMGISETAAHFSNKSEYPNFFRVSPSDVWQGRLLADLCMSYAIRSVSLLFSNVSPSAFLDSSENASNCC